MNKQEFVDYLSTYNKKRGFFTSDEIYQICLAFKTLPQEDKNWQELINTLGIDRTVNGLRSWVNKRYNRELLKKNTPHVLTCEERKIYIEKQKVRDDLNIYRSFLRDEARLSKFKEDIIETIKNMPKLDLTHARTLKKSQKELVLMFSDMHLGVKCDNLCNKYNIDIAKERVSKLIEDVKHYYKLYSADTIHFCNLGDLIHGIIHKNARIESECDLTKQIIYASEIVANALNNLQKICANVIYHSATDNHARIMPDKEQHIEMENLNKITDWYLETRLKGSRVKFAHDNLDDSFAKFKLKNGKNVIISHGHLDFKNTVFQNYVGLTREYVDYILLGHLHNSNVHNFQNCRVFINGSICGTEQYAMSKRLYSQPCQKLLIFGDNDNIIDIDINL